MPSSQWRTDDPRGDSGYATVAAAGFAAVLVMLCGVLAWQMGSVVAAAQAQRAADLAAVAGAYRLAVGADAETACATATWVAELNSATLPSCGITGEDVIVRALVRGHTAQARAGPL